MQTTYAIGPSIGIARLGDSEDGFYLAPDAIGALPITCDTYGNIVYENGEPKRVTTFKDSAGQVLRQGALFRIFRIDDAHPDGEELTLDHPDVSGITWVSHLANKKAAWYNFAELEGNLLYGADNSYEARNIPLRNAGVTQASERQKLIIDPGPRRLSGPNQSAKFDAAPQYPYPHVSFPKPPLYGQQITTLGNMLTDSAGRLVVLGGFGRSGGDASISSFAGADTWHDDISDGPVTCALTLKNGQSIELQAWCIVGSPKFAPEIDNIVTLDDTMWDVAVRKLRAAPQLFVNGAFNTSYIANFDRDILPILDRPGHYRWVANTQAMNSLSPPPFDARDSTDATAAFRRAYFTYFRQPSPENSIGPDAAKLFLPGGFPLMPLNSGSNSVSNVMIDKFCTLTETQYFLLSQWAAGKFETTPAAPEPIPTQLSRAAVGNCVGGPFCPGIEVTWSTRNPNIYSSAFTLRQRHPEDFYLTNGLSPTEDETADTLGCEPGDMTKRMAIPWQADFFQCSVQFINFTESKINKENGIPKPPTYYAYWWPPQSPWLVITGDLTAADQQAAGTPAGMQVLYTRGVNTFSEMIGAWSKLGFVVNQSTDPLREMFPYFTEQERNHEAFVAAAVAVGDASNVVTGADTTFNNAWFLPPASAAPSTNAATSRPAVSFSSSRRRGRVALGD